MTTAPTVWVIAGPNGVGKTTYAFRHIRAVSGSVHFVNLDEIARGLAPFDPSLERMTAARIAIRQIRGHLKAGRSFSLETTLSGRTHLGTLARAKDAGFAVNLLFFHVPEVEECLRRVARRITEGGHAVPEADVRRRYDRGIRMLPAYLEMADSWRVLDNSGPQPQVRAEGQETSGHAVGEAGLAPLAPALRTILAPYVSA